MADHPTIMALLRGMHLAAMLSLLGSAGFLAWMFPAAADGSRRRLNRLLWVSGLLALLAGTAWFVLQSAVIAGADTVSDVSEALPLVAVHTRYGNALIVRLGLLSAATGLALFTARGSVRLYLILVLTALALSLQGLIGHAGATAGGSGEGLVTSEALHLVAAGLWLGALLPLALTLLALPPAQAALVCERFTPIGLACVLVLAGSGLAQGAELIGSRAALFGTPYGQLALLKVSLFVVALLLAALNRLSLTDRLASDAANGRRLLLLSIGFESLIGLAIVSAAAFLASSPSPAHAAAALPLQFNLTGLIHGTSFGRAVILGSLVTGSALVLTTALVVPRPLRRL